MIPKPFLILKELSGEAWPHICRFLIHFIDRLREIKDLPSKVFLSDLIYQHYLSIFKKMGKSYESFLLNVFYAIKNSPENHKLFLWFFSNGPEEELNRKIPSGNPKYPQFRL